MTGKRFFAALLALSLLVTPVSQAEEAQPKSLWGTILKAIAPSIFSAFSEWLVGKLTESTEEGSMARLAVNISGAIITTVGGHLGQMDFSSKDIILVGAAPNAQAGTPQTPLKVEDGKANYHGVHVSLVVLDDAGNPAKFRATSEGFRTGERFKLRAVSTFGGLLVIDNINPRKEQKQIYPMGKGQAVLLQQGKETLIPLGRNEYFTFAGATGEEQLVITVRDPKAFGKAASAATVYRKDEAQGSSFVQEVTGDTYPVISQSLALRHH